jgi:hypothetical protein
MSWARAIGLELEAREPALGPTSVTTQERQRWIHEEIAMMRGAQEKMMRFQRAWNLLK